MESVDVSRPRAVWIVQCLFGITALCAVIGLFGAGVAVANGWISPVHAASGVLMYVLVLLLIVPGMKPSIAASRSAGSPAAS